MKNDIETIMEDIRAQSLAQLARITQSIGKSPAAISALPSRALHFSPPLVSGEQNLMLHSHPDSQISDTHHKISHTSTDAHSQRRFAALQLHQQFRNHRRRQLMGVFWHWRLVDKWGILCNAVRQQWALVKEEETKALQVLLKEYYSLEDAQKQREGEYNLLFRFICDESDIFLFFVSMCCL
jgi:hypothetical protein